MLTIFKKGIPLAILSLVSTANLAQDELDLDDQLFLEDDFFEEIVVTGFRSRLKANLDQKRFSDSVLDGISAEDIGKFPDKNIADSLQRVTGVSITRDFGEGEKISIRGTAPGLNRTLLNGQNVATADWFILDSPTRSFNYSLLASEMVSALEVYKSPQADIDEGSIGGTVILRTRKPLSTDANTVKASIQMAYTELSDKWEPQASGFYSWHNEQKNFGALVSLVHQQRSLRRDGFEILGYDQQTVNGQELYVPALIGSSLFEQERQRNGALVSLQYKPIQTLTFDLNLLSSKLDADNLNHNMLAVPSWQFDQGRTPAGPAFSDVSITNNTLTAATYGSDQATGAVLDVANRTSYSETQAYDLEIGYDYNNWQFHWQLGYTQAEGGTTRDVFSEFVANTSVSYDLSSQVPEVSFNDIQVTDAAAFNQLDWVQVTNKPQQDEETYGQMDVTYFFDDGFVSAVKVGVKHRDHDKSQKQIASRFHVPTSGYDTSYLSDLQQAGTSLDQFSNELIADDYMSGVAKSGSLTSYPKLDSAAFESVLFAQPNRVVTAEFLPDYFAINEKINAAYTKFDFEGDEYRGNFGVRYVETKLSSQAWRWQGSWLAPQDQQIEALENSYSDLLPSINVTYDLNEEMLMRFAASKVMARPEYAQISHSRNLNTSVKTGTGGNPELSPFRANQFDVSYEWYFADTGLLSAAVFYKEIESYTVNTTVIETLIDEVTLQPTEYQINLPINSDGGSNKGLEIGYQQDLPYNLGLIANYTYSDAQTDGGDLIPGNSKHTINATVYYENESLSARVSYNHRTEYFEGLDRGSELFTDGFAQVDASVSYELNDNVSLVAQALNLTDEAIYKYSNDKSRPYAWYKNGRRLFVGVQLSF